MVLSYTMSFDLFTKLRIIYFIKAKALQEHSCGAFSFYSLSLYFSFPFPIQGQCTVIQPADGTLSPAGTGTVKHKILFKKEVLRTKGSGCMRIRTFCSCQKYFCVRRRTFVFGRSILHPERDLRLCKSISAF